MSDYTVMSLDPTFVDLNFRLDDRLMELDIDSTAYGVEDLFVRSEPGINIWSFGDMKGLIQGLLSFDGIVGSITTNDPEILLKDPVSDAAVAKDDACFPPYAGRLADRDRGIAAGVFVFGPVFMEEGDLFAENWEISRHLWEGNAIGILRCLPGVATDF
jgi:hypothetical protein